MASPSAASSSPFTTPKTSPKDRICGRESTPLQMWNLVAQNLLVNRDEDERFELRLCYKQSIKWIAMVLGKLSGPLRVLDADRQGLKPVPLNCSCGRSREGQFSRSLFDRNLPNRHCAHENLVVRRADCDTQSSRQSDVVRVPPEKNVRIEQQIHLLKPEILQHVFRQWSVKVLCHISDPQQVLSPAALTGTR